MYTKYISPKNCVIWRTVLVHMCTKRIPPQYHRRSRRSLCKPQWLHQMSRNCKMGNSRTTSCSHIQCWQKWCWLAHQGKCRRRGSFRTLAKIKHIIWMKFVIVFAKLPSFPQLLGIQLHASPQLVSILLHVDDWVQVKLIGSQDINWQPCVELMQEFLHSQMSFATKRSNAGPWHLPGFEQSTQSKIGKMSRL